MIRRSVPTAVMLALVSSTAAAQGDTIGRSAEDSVDVLVVTRDVFSIGGSFSPRGVDETKFKIYDANFLGMGQRIQFNGHYDPDRDPSFGYEVYYHKSSLG